MTSGRPRIVALQAIVVACLLTVVYLTLLRPSGDTSLVGVEGRGRERPALAAPGGERPHRPGTRPRRRGEPPRAQRRGSSSIVAGAAVGSAGAAAPTGAPAPGSAAGPSPGDDQYEDSLGRLLGRLGAGAATGL